MTIKWISNEYNLTIGKLEIGSFVYVGDTPKKGSLLERYYNSCIDVSLPIGKKGYKSKKPDTGKFLKYSELTANERATYLHWLASSRQSPQFRSDFVRLYASGLEYRFFKDDSSLEEKRVIYEEVERLSRFYGDRVFIHSSFDRFLPIAKAISSPSNYSPEYGKHGGFRSLAFAIAIGRDLAEGVPITAERSLAWWRSDSKSRLERINYACEEEFPILYKYLFNEKYPDGLIMAPPQRQLVARYSAVFGMFSTNIEFEANGKPVPDISDYTEPVEIFQSIVNETLDSLAKLSRYRFRMPKQQNSLDEFALVPSSIRHKCTPYEISALKNWLKKKTPNSNFTIGILFEWLEFRHKKTIKMIRYKKICDALAKIGFGLNPDPRLTSLPPKFNEKILVFEVEPNEDHTTAVHDSLLAGIVEIGIGVYLAETLGKTSDVRKKALKKIINRLKPTKKVEKAALASNLEWFMKTTPNVLDFRRFLRKASDSQKKSIRLTVIDIAQATGTTNKEVIARVEQIYKLIGLDTVAAYSDIHAGQIVEQPRSKRRLKRVESAKDSVAKVKPGQRVRLDENKVKILSKETQEVSKLLTNIFGEEVREATEPTTNSTQKTTRTKEKANRKRDSLTKIVFKGLDSEYIPLTLDVLSKVYWTEKQIAKLADKHSLMWQGSLEVINEWSFDEFGTELIEEYDGYQLNAVTVGKLSKRVRGLNDVNG